MRNLEHIRGDKKLIYTYILETAKYIVEATKKHLKQDVEVQFNSKVIQEPLEKIVNIILEKGEHSGILLLGGVGVGKTVLMEATTRVFSAMYGIVERLDAQDMIRAVSNEEGYFVSGIHFAEQLYIDDLGVEHKRYIEFGQEIKPFDHIIHERYIFKPKGGLFVTTNLELKDISDRYGSRVFSRLAEMCSFIRMEGEDFRKQ